jgi:hypothetical protein
MATQNWLSPNPLDTDPIAPPPLVSGYDLRPLTVGEILDRVFSLYRTHFWFLVGLSAVSAGASVATAILRLIFLHFSVLTVKSPAYIPVIGALAIAQWAFYLIAYSLTLAATTSAVNAFYLVNQLPWGLRCALRDASGCAASALHSGRAGVRYGSSCFCCSHSL